MNLDDLVSKINKLSKVVRALTQHDWRSCQ